jgi:hypothetical protein
MQHRDLEKRQGHAKTRGKQQGQAGRKQKRTEDAAFLLRSWIANHVQIFRVQSAVDDAELKGPVLQKPDLMRALGYSNGERTLLEAVPTCPSAAGEGSFALTFSKPGGITGAGSAVGERARASGRTAVTQPGPVSWKSCRTGPAKSSCESRY